MNTPELREVYKITMRNGANELVLIECTGCRYTDLTPRFAKTVTAALCPRCKMEHGR